MKRRYKKKGSLIIEQIIVTPILIGLLWLIMQMIIFVYSNNLINTAANESSQVISQMMRGNPSKVNQLSTDVSKELTNHIAYKVKEITDKNKFILLNKDLDSDEEFITIDKDKIKIDESKIKMVVENQSVCEQSIKSDANKRVICIFTEELGTGSQAKTQQLVVRIKAPFHLIGSIIPNIDTKISLYGYGASAKEMPGRLQYYSNQ